MSTQQVERRSIPRKIILGLITAIAPWTAANEIDLIADPRFSCGFRALGVHPLRQVQDQVLTAPDAECAPVWELCEWWCGESLIGTPGKKSPDGTLRFEGATHFVAVDSKKTLLTLGLSSTRERRGIPRGPQEDWPHLLLQQQFKPEGQRCPPLDQLEALPFHVEARVVQDIQEKPEGYDPGLHAAQFLIYITVANRHTGDFLWFGINLYDDRDPRPGLSTYPGDGGSAGLGKFIYAPPLSAFTSETLHDGEWVRLEADLLPLMKDGLKRAWEEGFLQASQEVGDYYVSYMNLGLELPGLHDFVAQIKDLSLKARIAR